MILKINIYKFIVSMSLSHKIIDLSKLNMKTLFKDLILEIIELKVKIKSKKYVISRDFELNYLQD